MQTNIAVILERGWMSPYEDLGDDEVKVSHFKHFDIYDSNGNVIDTVLARGAAEFGNYIRHMRYAK